MSFMLLWLASWLLRIFTVPVSHTLRRGSDGTVARVVASAPASQGPMCLLYPQDLSPFQATGGDALDEGTLGNQE